MRLRQLFMAFRTPLILVSGIVLLVTSTTLVPNLILIQGYNSAIRTFFCTMLLSPDCATPSVLYIPNTAKILAYLVMLFALLEAKHVFLGPNRNIRWDCVTVLVAFGLAAAPWFLLFNILGWCLRLLPSLLAYTAAFWLFIVVNADLYVLEKYFTNSRWASHLAGWTFPVSDIVFFGFHWKRMGLGSSVVRLVPVLSYVGIISVVLWMEVGVLGDTIKVDKIGISGDTQFVLYGTDGLWYSDKDGARSGIWRYDPESGMQRPYIRSEGVDKFYLENGFFYFPDGYEKEVLKVRAESRRIAWRVPVPDKTGPFELVLRDGLIFVVGKGGYIAVIDTDGHVKADRFYPNKTWHPQALPGGRIAFVSPNRPEVRITGPNLVADEIIPLPLAEGILKFGNRSTEDPGTAVITSTAYVEDSRTIYVATVWGELFRYELNGRRWLPSLGTAPGVCSIAVDGSNGLLFAYNCARGYIDIVDIDSGKHLKYMIVDVFGNSLSLNPNAMMGILTTRRQGMYRFDYRPVATSRSVRAASGAITLPSTPNHLALIASGEHPLSRSSQVRELFHRIMA